MKSEGGETGASDIALGDLGMCRRSIPRQPRRRYAARAVRPDDLIPDARDGLTRAERIVLRVLHETQIERDGRAVRTTMIYGRVLEHIDMSIGELEEILRRLGAASPLR